MTNELDKSSYLGNSNLRRSGTKHHWTQDQVKEWFRCKADPIYFIENYVHIITIDHGLQLMELYDFQKEMVHRFHKHLRNVCVLGRQSGKSTTFAAFCCWYIIFHKAKTAAILAHKASTAQEILSRVQLAYEHIPKWMQQGIKEWNKRSFKLENESEVLAAATDSGSLRGFTVNLLFMDEVAHIPTNLYEDFFRSVYPTISSGKTSRVIMVSTPSGLNHFYDIVEKARRQRSQYVLSEYDWTAVPGRDQEWKENMIAETSEKDFRQEHEVKFLGSSFTLLDGPTLTRLSEQLADVKPVELKYSDRFKVYEKPDKERTYFLIADPGEGVERDYSAINVIDITEYPFQQVATFRCNKTSELLFAPIIESIARYYNEALVMVESNKGGVVLHSLNFEFEYENLIHYTPQSARGSRRKDSAGISKKMGIECTKLVKRIGCSRLKEMIEGRHFNIQCKDTLEEFFHFIENKNSYEAEQGHHDDLVMGLVLFAFYANTNEFTEYQRRSFSKEYMQRHIDNIQDELLPPSLVVDSGLDAAEESFYEDEHDDFFDSFLENEDFREIGIESLDSNERKSFLS